MSWNPSLPESEFPAAFIASSVFTGIAYVMDPIGRLAGLICAVHNHRCNSEKWRQCHTEYQGDRTYNHEMYNKLQKFRHWYLPRFWFTFINILILYLVFVLWSTYNLVFPAMSEIQKSITPDWSSSGQCFLLFCYDSFITDCCLNTSLCLSWLLLRHRHLQKV